MSREERVQFEGAFYHVMSRGNDKRRVFVDNDDRWRFVNILSRVVKEFGWLCHAYCLMGNHYHLFLETPRANLSHGMQYLNGRYCQCFNNKHARVGHLIQGRFKSILVQDDRYLFRLLRYICLNPVKEGMVGAPEAWRWSNYSATAGLTRIPIFLDTSFTLSLFSDDPKRAIEDFRAFIAEGMKDPHEIEDRRRLLEFLFDGVFDRQERDAAMKSAHDEYGFNVTEIATYLGLHRTTASRIVNECSKRV
jgi:REP element-mobilizing transposase RayT